MNIQKINIDKRLKAKAELEEEKVYNYRFFDSQPARKEPVRKAAPDTKVPGSGDTDIIWQQLTVKYFYLLLSTNCLYFKALNKYSDADERKLRFYKEAYQEAWKIENAPESVNKPRRMAVGNLIDEFEKKLYVSCWYHSNQLSDVIFREYAKDFAGVAIGVNPSKLISAIQNHSGDSIKSRKKWRKSSRLGTLEMLLDGQKIETQNDDCLLYGDVAYMPDHKTDIFHKYDMVAPIFVKSQNHYDDREFRLCYVDEHNGDALGPGRYIQIGNAFDLIDKIAVKKDDPLMLHMVSYLLCNSFMPGSIADADVLRMIERSRDKIKATSDDKDGFLTIELR